MTKRNSEYFVYLIRGGDHVKIGITGGSPMRRLKTLQTGNPEPLELIDFRNMQTSGRAARIEAGLHKRFDDQRVNGEWFALDDAQVDEARGIIREQAERAKQSLVTTDSYDDLPKKWKDYMLSEWRTRELMMCAIPSLTTRYVVSDFIDACNGNTDTCYILTELVRGAFGSLRPTCVDTGFKDGVYSVWVTLIREDAERFGVYFDGEIETLRSLGYVGPSDGNDSYVSIDINRIWSAVFERESIEHGAEA